jgi:hypothetical protein
MRRLTAIALALLFSLPCIEAAEELPLQAWIDEAIAAGGGVVTVPPGEHILRKGLIIKDAKKISVRGVERETCILRLPPVTVGKVAKPVPAGGRSVEVLAARGWQAGMQVQFETSGELDSFTGKPKPHVLGRIASVEEGRLMLQEALTHPIPEGCLMRDPNAPNLIEVRGKCEGVEIANLVLDGGRREGDPAIQGHAQLCALLAQGDYDYRRGPTGPQPAGIVLRDCIIENCFGRGAAFYSCKSPRVERCSIRDCNDEAIDFDHFTPGAVALGNRIIRCRIGLELNDAESCLLQDNELEHCGIGINAWRFCRQADFNRRHRLLGNRISDCSGNGIQIAEGTLELMIEDNRIADCRRNGISLNGDHHQLRRNRITGCSMKPIAINQGEHRIEP